jgi:hypothetical protein
VRITDGEHGGRSCDQCPGRELLPIIADQPGEAGDEPEQRKGPDARDPRTDSFAAQREAALDPDQQSAGERRPDREGLPVKARVQRSRSECQCR